MANEQNLIPNSKRTPSERRENAKKAGKASGKARRQKSNLRQALLTVLALEVTDQEIRDELERMGIETTMEQGLALQVVKRALLSGDYKAMETIMASTGEHTKEQDAKIKKTKAETEKLKAEVKLATQTDDEAAEPVNSFIEALAGAEDMEDLFDDPEE